MNNLKKHNEIGRSFVEMLGVVDVIGVLSVAEIAGYSTAMRRYFLLSLSIILMGSTAFAGGSIFGGHKTRSSNPDGVSSIGIHICGSLNCPDVILKTGDCSMVPNATLKYGVCVCDDGYKAVGETCEKIDSGETTANQTIEPLDVSQNGACSPIGATGCGPVDGSTYQLFTCQDDHGYCHYELNLESCWVVATGENTSCEYGCNATNTACATLEEYTALQQQQQQQDQQHTGMLTGPCSTNAETACRYIPDGPHLLFICNGSTWQVETECLNDACNSDYTGCA